MEVLVAGIAGGMKKMDHLIASHAIVGRYFVRVVFRS